MHDCQAAVQRYQAKEHDACVDIYIKYIANQLTGQLAIRPAMASLQVKHPQWQGEQLEEIRQQEIEDVYKLAASATWATQLIESPQGQKVAGQAQREDQAIDTSQAESVRVQGEITAVIRHLSVDQVPDIKKGGNQLLYVCQWAKKEGLLSIHLHSKRFPIMQCMQAHFPIGKLGGQMMFCQSTSPGSILDPLGGNRHLQKINMNSLMDAQEIELQQRPLLFYLPIYTEGRSVFNCRLALQFGGTLCLDQALSSL